MTKENIPEYSVTELSTALKSTIEDNFGYVRIKGELSGINNHSSGHIYLTLKDENAVINGIIWRSSVAKIKIRPEEGLEVICTGKISTGYNPGRYAGRSNYQITIDTIKPAGAGALMAILEERKEKLKSDLLKIAPEILKFSQPVWLKIDEFKKQKKKILFEGAQGILLDVNHGTYPYVTFSTTLASSAAKVTGCGPNSINILL